MVLGKRCFTAWHCTRDLLNRILYYISFMYKFKLGCKKYIVSHNDEYCTFENAKYILFCSILVILLYFTINRNVTILFVHVALFRRNSTEQGIYLGFPWVIPVFYVQFSLHIISNVVIYFLLFFYQYNSYKFFYCICIKFIDVYLLLYRHSTCIVRYFA